MLYLFNGILRGRWTNPSPKLRKKKEVILSQNYLSKMSMLCPVVSMFTWSLKMSHSGHISVLYFFTLNTISSDRLIQSQFSEENVMYSLNGRVIPFSSDSCSSFFLTLVSQSLCRHLRWDFHPGLVYWTDVCHCLAHSDAANYLLCQKK